MIQIPQVVYVKIIDDDTNVFGISDCSDYDVLVDASFSYKLMTQKNWSYGNYAHNWRYFFPTIDDEITRNIESFRYAIQHQNPKLPLLIKINQDDHNFLDKRKRKCKRGRNQQVDTGLLVNRHGRQMRNYFCVEAKEQIITCSTPYANDIKFGAFIIGCHRPCHPMDNEIIDLHLLKDKYRTAFVAIIIAKVYAALYTDNEYCHHEINNFLMGKTFSRMIRRIDNNNNVANIAVACTQSGKSKEILATAIFNIFLGRDSLVFMRNIGGNQSIVSFELDRKEISDLVRDYVENVLDIDMRECDGFIDDIQIYDGLTMKRKIAHDGIVERGFIYVERTNVTKLELPFKNIYNELVGRDMFSLIIDEEDEQRQSSDATLGKTENVLYNKSDFLGNISIFNAAHMAIAYTATFLSLVSSKPASIEENYRFNVFEITPSNDYKGHYRNLPENRTIVRMKVDRKKFLKKSEKQGKSVNEIVLESNPGIRTMLNHMTMLYNNNEYPYISGLIVCSAIARNDCKQDFAKKLLLQGLPSIAFAQNEDSSFEFFFDAKNYFTDINEDKLKKALSQAFNGKHDRFKYKKIEFKSVIKTDTSFVIIPSNKSMKTIQIAYDIVRMLYELTEKKLKPIVLCVSFLMANRGTTYKTSNHDMPLTHMYASTKTPASQYAVDVKQVAGRICGIDQFNFQRYLFAPEEFINLLYTSYRVDSELIAKFSNGQHTVAEIHGYAMRTFDQALEDVKCDTEVGKVAHHTKIKLVKKRVNEYLLHHIRIKVPCFERIDEYSTNDREQFDQDTIIRIIEPKPDMIEQDEIDDMQTEAKARMYQLILKLNGQRQVTANELHHKFFELMVQEYRRSGNGINKADVDLMIAPFRANYNSDEPHLIGYCNSLMYRDANKFIYHLAGDYIKLKYPDVAVDLYVEAFG